MANAEPYMTGNANTPTRVRWVCPGCGQLHALVMPRREAREALAAMMDDGVLMVALYDETAALLLDADKAEELGVVMYDVPKDRAPTQFRRFIGWLYGHAKSL